MESPGVPPGRQLIHAYLDRVPTIGERVYLVESAEIIGNVTIENDSSVWFNAVIRGDVNVIRIGDACLIGMGSIVLDGATVGERSLVAAGSLVRTNDVIPPRVLAAGSPAQVVRPLTREEVSSLEQSALNYMAYVRNYRGS